MPEIQVDRDMIIHGSATRLELNDTDLGPTVGAVVVRREVELIDIMTDIGTIVDKFQSRDQMFIEMELAQSTLNNLVVAWGGAVTRTTDSNGVVTSMKLALDPEDNPEMARQLILEGPGVDDFFRRYTFPKVISLVQTDQNIQKSGIISVPIEFEVMMDPQLDDSHFGKIEELTTAITVNIVSGNNQTGTIGNALANPFVIEVRDSNGDPFIGATVNFIVITGAGSLSLTTDTTDANGQAQTTLTLGNSLVTNIVRARVDGIFNTADFTATAQSEMAASLHRVSGNNQSALINQTLANPFVVEARDQANQDLPGVIVNFAVTAGGGSISIATAATDAIGRAQTRLTLGQTPGTNTVRATSAGVSTPVDFTATGETRIATSLAKISGDNQSVVINGTLANPFVAEVQDRLGNALPGVTVNFAVTAGSGSVSNATGITDSNGRAGTTLTVGSTIGTNTVRSTVSGISTPVDFNATALEQLATTLAKISGDNQIGVISESLTNPFVVEVRDQIGNGMPGVTVDFAVTVGGGSVSNATDTTDSNGRADTTLTLGAITSNNTVRATVDIVTPIITPIEFTANGQVQIATTLTLISGNNQTGTIGNALANPFVVEVRDQIGNGMPDITVDFTVTAGGGSVSNATDTTDSNGRADTTLTLGAMTGTNTVRATVADISSPVNFNATT